MSSLKDVRIIDLPKFEDLRGNLSFIEENNHIPFRIARTYWVYDVPGGEVRGGHAYKTLHEFIVALSGSFDVLLDDGTEKRNYHLNRSYYGLYVPDMSWRSMENFSTNSLCLVLASDTFNPEEYVRDYDDFLNRKLHTGIQQNTADQAKQK
jgi:dTDP-4-dehydrorhamnose 3,5-epimerase-like enzyme